MRFWACVLISLLSAGAALARTHSNPIAKLPLSFEPAAGPDTAYVARGPGYTLTVRDQENVLTLADPGSKTRASVRIKFLRARHAAKTIEALEPLPSHTNYFFGRDPRNWRTNVAHFGKVRVDDLYPGVDLVYYGAGGTLEYDFILHPGADPRAIEFQISGAKEVTIDPSGDLVLFAKGQEVRWKAPRLYQSNGRERTAVDGRFELTAGRRVRFRVGDYDRARELVIDPVLSYTSYLGGSGNDFATGIATDAAGNVYVAGGVSSSNLAVTVGVVQSAFAGGPTDAFVAKFNSSGALIYLTYLGGGQNDYAVSVAADSSGNAYVPAPPTLPISR